MAILTDIVLIIDESGSMSTEQEWLESLIPDLDAELLNRGVSPRYAIIGFDSALHSSNAPHKHQILGADFSDEVSEVVGVLNTEIVNSSGGDADLYVSIEYALNGANYAWRDGAVKAFILVTDTCRETGYTDSDTPPYTYSETLSLLRDNNVLTAFVVNIELEDVDTSLVLGGNFDLTSYMPDGAGGFTEGVWDLSELDNGRPLSGSCANSSGYVKEAYVDLGLAANGSVWDIHFVETSIGDFLLNTSSFSSAFSSLFAQEVISSSCDSPIPTIPFYCPSTKQSLDSVIKFTQTNPLDEYAPDLNRHYRVTFYSDATKERVVYSSFSLVDDKRWYISGSTYEAMTDEGATIPNGTSVEIVYVPDIYPQQLFGQQHLISFSRGNSESYLLSGVKYYATIESYDIVEGSLDVISEIEFMFDASDVETNFWRENLDQKNWISSANGQSDLLVSNSGEQSLFPSVASNIFGLFYIANQSLRNGSTTIVRSFWNTTQDKIYGSGQGLWETEGPFAGQKPDVITDQGQNFPIVSNDDTHFYYSNCALPTIETETDNPSIFVPVDNTEFLCFPGTSISVAEDFYVRVSEEDTTGSFVVNKDEAVSVVEKTNINIDISGIYGVHAVRFRNQDGLWGEWIDVDNNAFVENNRFIVPWKIPRANGLRHLCCQVLTVYGVSQVKCIDIFVNMVTVDYFINYYSDATRTEEVPAHEGFSLLATKGGDDAEIFIRVTFSEPQTEDNLTFDVIHQGISNVFDRELSPEEIIEGVTPVSPYLTYIGSFLIRKEDGIYDIDGTGFIKVKFPGEDTPPDNCVSDRRDLYNQMLIQSELDFLDTTELTPEESFRENATRTVLKVLDINDFKQYYDNDDPNFLFGNAGFYRN